MHTQRQKPSGKQNVSSKLDKALLDKNTHIDHRGFTAAALKVQEGRVEEVCTRGPVLPLFFPRGLQNRLKSSCLRATVISEL